MFLLWHAPRVLEKTTKSRVIRPQTCTNGLDHLADARHNVGMRTFQRHSIERHAGSLAALIVLCVGLCASPAGAGFIGGGGKPEADCYAGLDVTDVASSSGSRIECTEGDACDASPCGDGKCTFEIRVCANRSGISGCTPPAGGLVSLKAAGPLKSAVPANLTGATCGQPVTLDLKLKKDGTKKNKRVIRAKATAVSGVKPRKDQDSFLFFCLPRTSACPASPSGAFLR